MVVDVANEASFTPSPEPVEEDLRALPSSPNGYRAPKSVFGMQTRSPDNKEWLKVRYNAILEKKILSRLLK
ncbi:hypothetical protein AnigIFM60653_007760 [Aspergillus niger]|nr:hypothetical protein AnigIFM50267_011646 [Aspergillus niger]GLA06812.1 hypothetical protein AnigIFM60653_007760 [Aspergillus niger]